MPEDTQVVNPPADAAVAASDSNAAPTPNPLEERLNRLESELAQTRATVGEKDALLNQYQSRLAQLIQAQQQPAQQAQPNAQFDSETTRFVSDVSRKQAEEVVNKTLSTVMLRSEIYQRLGNDQEAMKAADREYQQLKTNPYYAGQSDEILYALAVDRGRNVVLESRLNSAKADSLKRQETELRQSQAAGVSLPSTPGGLRTATNTNPDADLNEYMADPKNQQGFRKLIANVDPLSDTQVKWGGKYVPARDAFKDLAIRCCRKGVGVGRSLENLAGGKE